jgi:hypothetical protein
MVVFWEIFQFVLNCLIKYIMLGFQQYMIELDLIYLSLQNSWIIFRLWEVPLRKSPTQPQLLLGLKR